MAADRPTADAYRWFTPITTRWMDNDVYGHINNVVYYSFFDTAANQFLIEHGLDIASSDTIGLVVESKCAYHAPIAYPQRIRAGVRVDKLGNRSVTYGIAIFVDDASSETSDSRIVIGGAHAVAHGHFVHVFVDRASRSPVAIPERLRAGLASIAVLP